MEREKTPCLWLVSPVYHDTESFLTLREKLGEIVGDLPFHPGHVRFVVVDDSGGLDPEILGLSQLKDVEVLRPPFNLGHQRAIVFGLRSLCEKMRDEDVIVTLDADGEDQPEDLRRVLQPLASAPKDLQVVSLALRTQRRESFSFKIMYAMFKLLFVFLTGTVVRTGNFAAFRGWFARNVLFHPYFDLCYSSALLSLNRPLAFVPCGRGQRYSGKSRMSYLKLLMHGIRMLMPFLDRIAVRALIAFSIAFAAGVILALSIVGVRLFTSLAIPGWATYTLLLTLLLSFVALGNFVILFALFSQSQGISMSFLDRDRHESS
jgi:polyisoprenyl-phosphate glycosyltransferase